MKKLFLKYAACCFILLLLIVPDIYAKPKMELLATGIPISITQRHEWHPWVEYNSVDKEFMVLTNISGSLDGTGDISYHSLNAQRVSVDGELLGDQILISPPEGLDEFVTWKSMPKLAYNNFSNEYMVAYMIGYTYNNPFYPYGPPAMWAYYNVIEKVRINNVGEVQGDGPVALWPTLWNASHTAIAFNSQRQEYLVVYDDKYIFTNDTNIYDQPGFILDAEGNVISGNPIGNPIMVDYGPGSHFSPYVVYNPIDDTYMLNWEDFRHVPPGQSWMYGPFDIYGSILDGEGNIIVDPVVNVDDTGQPDEGKSQTVPSIAHNPVDNEFLVAWTDSRPSLNGGGVIGRLINGDGTPKGLDFVIADGPGSQGAPKMVYVKTMRKYFVVWQDSRYYTPPPGAPSYARVYDIFARWLNPDGTPASEEIEIYVGPGSQTMPMLAYSPYMQRFLIAWRDENAPGDFTPVGPGAPMAPEIKADVRGALYGKPTGKP